MPSQVNAQIWIENEQSLVKCQIEGPNVDEILQIRYPQKVDEIRNPITQKYNDLDLRLGTNPSLKIRKKPHSNLGEKLKILISKL